VGAGACLRAGRGEGGREPDSGELTCGGDSTFVPATPSVTDVRRILPVCGCDARLLTAAAAASAAPPDDSLGEIGISEHTTANSVQMSDTLIFLRPVTAR
jgi:hypothetical protein